MANNVYIGNRYVPVFADPVEWDNLRQYEPLTIVTYQGTAYTSKKTVPVGTALSNTEYWVVTGNYNAQVEEYRQEVVALDGRVTTLNGTVTSQGNQITALGNRVTATEKVANTEKSARLDRHFLLIADSYGMRSTSQPTWTELWAQYIPNTRQKSVSSIGFTTGTNPSNFKAQLEAFYNELTAAERAEITDIVVAGGYNDARVIHGGGSESQLILAIQDFLNYAITNFPNAVVSIAFIGWETHDASQLVSTFSMFHAQRIYENTSYKRTKVLYGASSVMKNTNFMDDTQFHPNPTGSQYLYKALYNECVGGSFCLHWGRALTAADFTFNDGVSGTFSSGFVSMNGNIATLELMLLGVSANGAQKIGTFALNCLPWGHLKAHYVDIRTYGAANADYGVINQARELMCYNASHVANQALIIRATVDAYECP